MDILKEFDVFGQCCIDKKFINIIKILYIYYRNKKKRSMSHVDHVYCSCKFNSRVKISSFSNKTTSCVSNSIFKSKIKSISPFNNLFKVENLIPDLKRIFESI